MPIAPRTLIEKIWADHVVADLGEETDLLHIDRIVLHERSGSVAFSGLADAGRSVRCPDLVFATIDHVVDTDPGRTDATRIPGGSEFIRTIRARTREHGIRLFDLGDERQGIVHVVTPEQGIALPGLTLVCADSHTCTLGGVGTLAWGIGSTEGEHALATQTLVQMRPQTMRVSFDGALPAGTTAKDLVLHMIGRLGTGGGNGYAVEFAGSAIRALPVEGRLTLCNMAVEFSARTGIVAADDVTFEYLHGRPFAPKGAAWDRAVAYWRGLATDTDARFDREEHIDVAGLTPQVTWGTSPQHVLGIDGRVPDPAAAADANDRASMERALDYMGLAPGTALDGLEIGAAFIGSCTNARLSDLRAAAAILRGRKVAAGLRAICVPGSSLVKKAAEAEGLDRIFREAGFEWRESGCSLCFSAGGDSFGPQQRVISTTNRNFEGRQGAGTRTHLASPATVAASAVAGRIADPRKVAA